MFRWLVPYPALIAIAALMGGIGYVLLCGFGPAIAGFDALITYLTMGLIVMGASVILWTALGLALGRRTLAVWAAVGLVSPLLGALILSPPVSFLVLFERPLITFPVGLATGLLAWWAFRFRIGLDPAN